MGDPSQFKSEFLSSLKKRYQHQPEYLQAVDEVLSAVVPWYLEHKDYQESSILDRIVEPDRVVSFRVCWETDNGSVQVNRGWRVQFNNCLGPYKGGLRFHPSVNESVLKFLGFEQVFKNSLTGLPMGGAKGGSDFNPKGRSDREIMRFCQAFMTELSRHIGEDVDIPAGDIGVGEREIAYLFGQFRRLNNNWGPVLTGKPLNFGGSRIRTEATGYGCIYFSQELLKRVDKSIKGMRIAISGAGNVALHAAELATSEGAKVITLSDSDGTLFSSNGLSKEQIDYAKRCKLQQHGSLEEVATEFSDCEFKAKSKPWGIECDIAMPCATQNEIGAHDAETLVGNGVQLVTEGANMPCTNEASKVLREAKVFHAPGKAANAGGVAVSGLEISQNMARQQWSADKVKEKLKSIMADIHSQCVAEPDKVGWIDYPAQANLAGFKLVSKVMLQAGLS